MEASFVLVTPDLSQRPIALNRPRTVIGRQTDCNIRIPSGSVSRQHCEILVEGDALRVRDLGSSNGTYVNRKRITEASLSAGDLVAVGQCVFVTQIDGEPRNVDSEDVLEDGAVATPDTSGAAAPGRHGDAPTVVSSRPSEPEAPAGKGRLVGSDDNDDSDAFDFDFSDDEDEKKKPKK